MVSRTLATNLVTRALEKALKQDSTNSPFSDSENNIAMDEMNDLMAELSNGFGIRIGYADVTLLTDETNLPAYSLGAVKNMLAVRLASEFGRAPDPLLVASASDSLDALIARVIEIPEVLFPTTLPTGQGHYYGRKFFSNESADDLETESGESIETERNFPLETTTIPTDPDVT